MSNKDGVDIFVDEARISSLRTSLQNDGTRQAFLNLADGAHLHLGPREVDRLLGRTFARASGLVDGKQVYAGHASTSLLGILTQEGTSPTPVLSSDR